MDRLQVYRNIISLSLFCNVRICHNLTLAYAQIPLISTSFIELIFHHTIS
jgi:hypothetical protein